VEKLHLTMEKNQVRMLVMIQEGRRRVMKKKKKSSRRRRNRSELGEKTGENGD